MQRLLRQVLTMASIYFVIKRKMSKIFYPCFSVLWSQKLIMIYTIYMNLEITIVPSCL